MVDREAESVIGPDDVVQVVFIVWEAASNAVRHAGATILAVSCRQIDRHVVVTVRDDGRGFDPRVQTHGTGRGLGNMARRARAIGADLNIDSGPGRGTEVRLALPIAAGGLVS
jgi:signal transduction histidine kinase